MPTPSRGSATPAARWPARTLLRDRSCAHQLRNSGYTSETFAHSVAEGIRAVGKPVFVYQLGGHDPSGLDGWRAFMDKVRTFAPDSDITFDRLAVTEQQIAELGLPTRPTKATDSRARRFVGESVDVDGIPARVLRAIVEAGITQHIDRHQLEATRKSEQFEREWLMNILPGRWS